MKKNCMCLNARQKMLKLFYRMNIKIKIGWMVSTLAQIGRCEYLIKINLLSKYRSPAKDWNPAGLLYGHLLRASPSHRRCPMSTLYHIIVGLMPRGSVTCKFKARRAACLRNGVVPPHTPLFSWTNPHSKHISMTGHSAHIRAKILSSSRLKMSLSG